MKLDSIHSTFTQQDKAGHIVVLLAGTRNNGIYKIDEWDGIKILDGLCELLGLDSDNVISTLEHKYYEMESK